MEPQRYLRCLGQPALFAPSGEPVRFRTKKHLALLIYLAVENKPQRRERIAELLWPKVSLSEARPLARHRALDAAAPAGAGWA